jgi:MFS family permease
MQINLNKHKKFKFLLFGSLYFAEGIYQAMILIVGPIYLINKNVPLPFVTLLGALIYLPWGLKFVWGGIIEFYHKYGRKKFAVFGIIFGAIGFLGISLIDQNFSIIWFSIFLFMGYVGIGFLDSAIDAWAIDSSIKEERGKINASMNIGKWGGQYVGALFIIAIGVALGYSISFFLTGIIVLFLVVIPLIVKYEDRKIGKLKIWHLVKQEFGKKITRITTFYFFIFVLFQAFYSTILVIYLKTSLNFDDTFIGFLYAFWLISVIPGSIIGGILADKFGRKIPLYVFLIFMIILSITPIIINNFYLITLIMDIINPKISAAEHEIICSIVNLGGIAIGSSTGTLIVLFGFDYLFILAALILLAALFVLYRIKNLNKIKWI